MAKLLLFLCVCIYCIVLISAAKNKSKVKEVDPKECEVCISNLNSIDALIPKEKKKDRDVIETTISTHCTKSGASSTWKASDLLTDPKDVKMCYYFEPIKKSISHPFSTGMPKAKVCQRLKKDNPEICAVKYNIKVEKKEGEEVDYSKLKVKQLKTILDQRGVKCTGCTEKTDFVRRCQETEHLEM